MIYPIIIMLLCCAVLAVSVGALLMLAHKRRAVNVWAGCMTIGAGAWSFLMLLFMVQERADLAELFARFYYVTALVMALGLYKFALYYPAQKQVSQLERIGTWLLFGGGVLLCLLPGYGVIESVSTAMLYNTATLNFAQYLVYIMLFAGFVCVAFLRLGRSYRSVQSSRTKKYAHQVLAMIYTLGVVALAGMYFDIILPLAGNYRDIWMGPPFTLIFTMYLLYVLTQQGIFDVRAVLARSVGYIAMIAVTLLLYAAVLFGVGGVLFGDDQPSLSQQLFYLGSALLLLLSVAPLRQWFDNLTYRVFYHREYSFNEVLQQFSTVTANEIDLGRVVTKSLAVLVDALGPSYVSLYVLSAQGKTYHFVRNMKSHHTPKRYKQQLETVQDILADLPRATRVADIAQFETRQIAEESGAKVIVQLMVKGEQVGVVFFGERNNGLPYSEQDMQLLATTADELALSVQNGLRFNEIKEFNKRLRKEVSSATSELRHSNQQLHKIDEVKDEFLSIASHQLRTPLTSVKGYISLVLDGDAGKINSQQRHLLTEAFTSSQRMVHLIEDFLNMSRLQTGRFMIDRQPTDIVKMVRDEVESLKTTAEARSMKLSLQTKGTLPTELVVDENKLRQVVMNFIDNAIYYSNPNSEIDVLIERKADSFILQVKDSGIGVPKSAQAQLFGKFYRAGNARLRRPDGTGIGLYLAKMVVIEHGGDIIFTSREGRGSTFGFSLPISKLEPREDQPDKLKK